MGGSSEMKWVACLALALVVTAGAGCSTSRGCRGECPANASGRSAGPAPAALPGAPPTQRPTAAEVPPTASAGKYGGQRTCPVMGDALGEMGEPIPVAVKGQTVYVCCRGCVAKVQRDPDKYLAVVAAERAGR